MAEDTGIFRLRNPELHAGGVVAFGCSQQRGSTRGRAGVYDLDVPSIEEHRLRVRVYLEDTDAGGIVYHASYLRFLERARTEWLRATGLDQTRTFATDLSFVVHSMRLRFLRPARLDDVLVITCDVRNVRAASLLARQRVILEATGEPCCTAEVTVACISLATHRARRLPAEIRERLAAG